MLAKGKKMNRKQLIAELFKLQGHKDARNAQAEAVELLLEYIGDSDIEDAYCHVPVPVHD